MIIVVIINAYEIIVFTLWEDSLVFGRAVKNSFGKMKPTKEKFWQKMCDGDKQLKKMMKRQVEEIVPTRLDREHQIQMSKSNKKPKHKLHF
jgi:hypothetical protein